MGAEPFVSCRVLVVDAVPSIALALRATLRRSGYTVTCADSVVAAEVWLAEGAYDIVVMDARLGPPAMALCAELRTRPDAPAVVLTTAYPASNVLRLVRESGADACLVKPFALADLVECVADLVGPGTGRAP